MILAEILPVDREKVKKEILQRRKNRKESIEEKFEKYKFSIPVILESESVCSDDINILKGENKYENN